MTVVQTVELRNNLEKYIDMVYQGEEVVLDYKKGRMVLLTPFDQVGSHQASQVLAFFEKPQTAYKIRKSTKKNTKLAGDMDPKEEKGLC
jgi:antitoxin (DNA-binding transcriptional repressor) of toxin-antitoxin stability system